MVLWLGATTTQGIQLKGHGIRKVERHCPRVIEPYLGPVLAQICSSYGMEPEICGKTRGLALPT